MSKKKIVLFVLLGLLLLPILAGIIRLTAYGITKNTAPKTTLSSYKSTFAQGWVVEEPYLLFPEQSQVENAVDYDYLHKRIIAATFLFDNDIVTFLSCTYNSEDFQAELARLGGLCGEADTSGYQYPAYVFLRNGRPEDTRVTRYALIDEAKSRIYYVTAQHKFALEDYVAAQYHPKDWR